VYMRDHIQGVYVQWLSVCAGKKVWATGMLWQPGNICAAGAVKAQERAGRGRQRSTWQRCGNGQEEYEAGCMGAVRCMEGQASRRMRPC